MVMVLVILGMMLADQQQQLYSTWETQGLGPRDQEGGTFANLRRYKMDGE